MSGLIRYKHESVTYHGEEINVEIMVGGVKTVCDLAHRQMGKAGYIFFVNDPALRNYCKTIEPYMFHTLIHYSDILWPQNVTFEKITSLGEFLLCVQEETHSNCSETIHIDSSNRSKRSANTSDQQRPALTPELFYHAINSTDCEYKNFGVNCKFSNPLLGEIFRPSVVVDTHLGPRNVTNLTKQEPVSIISPQVLNYFDHPIIIINSAALSFLSTYLMSFIIMLL